MTTRYSDIDIAVSGAKDFVIRRREPTLPQILLLFIASMMVVTGTTLAVADKMTLAILLFLLVAAIGWYAILQMQRERDLVLATEFQNALFASALGINNKFCLIIKRDGNIVYLDRSFQEMFPNFSHKSRRAIDGLLEHAKVAPDESEKIYRAIEAGVYDKAIFNIRDAQGNFHHIIMSVEPILRPSGFILLRGREFVENRNSVLSAPPLSSGVMTLNKPTITLFSHIMDTMNMGVYMAGPSGNIIYANSLLERWLDFNEDELNSTSLRLQDIIHQNNRNEPVEPVNYEGELTFHKKNGSLLKAFVNQKVICDENGKLIGCTAMVHHIGDQSAASSNKPW
jgi:two-component system cell cycle sensor histidine kinase/response regulator CckA